MRKVLQKAHMFNLVHFESMLYEKETEESFGSSSNDPYHIVESKDMKAVPEGPCGNPARKGADGYYPPLLRGHDYEEHCRGY